MSFNTLISGDYKTEGTPPSALTCLQFSSFHSPSRRLLSDLFCCVPPRPVGIFSRYLFRRHCFGGRNFFRCDFPFLAFVFAKKSSNSAAENKGGTLRGVMGSLNKKKNEGRVNLVCVKLLRAAKAGVELHGATDLISYPFLVPH